MMVIALRIDIGFHALCKIFNADLIRLGCFLTPVSGSGLAHEIHIDKHVHNGILNEVKLMTVLLPRLAVFIFKALLEFIHTPGLCKLLLQICQMRKGSAEALHLIEDAQEDIHDGILVLLAAGIALGIDIEEHNIRRCFRSQLHIRQHHRIHDLLVFHKEIQCVPVTDQFILQQIGQDLQEMRFTTSEEAGDPHAHLRRGSEDPFLVSGEEISKVLLQFSCHNVLVQLLRYVGFLTLANDDNALNFTVDLLGKHVFY